MTYAAMSRGKLAGRRAEQAIRQSTLAAATRQTDRVWQAGLPSFVLWFRSSRDTTKGKHGFPDGSPAMAARGSFLQRHVLLLLAMPCGPTKLV